MDQRDMKLKILRAAIDVREEYIRELEALVQSGQDIERGRVVDWNSILGELFPRRR